jgi:SpoVK/Ycf46/Vps4 family AAA+-type ATPase
MPIPDAESRMLLWQRSLASETPSLTHLRMTSGNIVRAASMARASATLSGAINGTALWSAIRTLDRDGLDALAQRIDPAGPWSLLAASAETREDLNTLTARCRQRERLGAFVGDACSGVSPGVRALFKGPSGTGKTLAARMLAGALGMDIYRVDLASVVNKYIGETEKNLDRVFARAEELDVILLLDEGDALLTQRTAVQSANDRYANLETNFLLQRLESYSGVLIVTTNAGDRIDTAFERRMDVVIEFALPDAAERRAIWEMHLPEAHQIDGEVLQAAAQRCALSGGQIRNAALHAALLAVDSGAPVDSSHLEAAVAREYRKQGGLSPLRSRGGPR